MLALSISCLAGTPADAKLEVYVIGATRIVANATCTSVAGTVQLSVDHLAAGLLCVLTADKEQTQITRLQFTVYIYLLTKKK